MPESAAPVTPEALTSDDLWLIIGGLENAMQLRGFFGDADEDEAEARPEYEALCAKLRRMA